MIDLLRRLEAKGVPLSVSSTVSGFLTVHIGQGRNITIASREDDFRRDHMGWLIIGAVVEYMEAQGWSAVLNYSKGGQAMVTFGALGGHVSTEAGDTLLEAILEAADKALG